MALHPEHDRPLTRHAVNGLALCAGVGGLELGLHIAEPGYRTVCYVEREAFAASTLVARMEDKALDPAPLWDDVTSFDGRSWRGKVHLVTGGYPCQPFSFAGKRKGEDDPRHLWPHIRRIVEEVDPEWCFFENVEGHLTLGAAQVFEDLRGLGYSVKAGMFSALEVGATHLRRRLFILAHADKIPLLQPNRAGAFSKGHEVQERPDAEGRADCPRQSGTALDTDVAIDPELECSSSGRGELPLFAPAPFEVGVWSEILDGHADLQPELLGLDHGVADRVDRSDAAGNGVVSLAAAHAWKVLKAAHMAL
ncbi:DNA cytosine methyltransferase [Roseibium denhamense]|uniref:DNA (cytosine-5-)-methyltransferase n=1 Tax=Roseibium denhamense TaxID=76305 RepID=A0ABY1NDX8_9HYPH|nr:DNA cytosine methyltransferase [Roseibium denhamense]SMP07081.1 DNA (cytosine-5)-methyltransferase 1 [Roseibium denhamense]